MIIGNGNFVYMVNPSFNLIFQYLIDALNRYEGRDETSHTGAIGTQWWIFIMYSVLFYFDFPQKMLIFIALFERNILCISFAYTVTQVSTFIFH